MPRPGRSATHAAQAPVIALILGVLLVGLYDSGLARSRYPYVADSASYIEMATSLRADGRPRVTPWDIESGDADAVPQPLFPPGFAVLIATLVPLAGDVRTAALIPSRVAAALLPFLLVVMWRDAAPRGVLLCLGLWVLLSPGVREWQFVAYSDVTGLALAVIALGALARPFAAGDPARASRGWWLAGGLAAGLCYAVRNAGLAVLAASAALLLYARLRSFIATRPLGLWALGAALPLAALAAYNLATFGTLQPYDMPASYRDWTANVVDYATAQLEDLGLPLAASAALPGAAFVALLGLLIAVGLAAWWRTREDPPRHVVLTLLGLYAVAGGVLLVASRSRYEWGNNIDRRNVLQYSFALALALLTAARGALPARAQRLGAIVLLAALAASAAGAAREALAAYRGAPEPWLALSRDASAMRAARELPATALVASNAAPLFRIAAPRAVRQLDLGSDDNDFADALARLRMAAGPRPAAFLLVCDEWTAGLSACRPGAARAGPACTRIRAADPVVARCASAGVGRGEGARGLQPAAVGGPQTAPAAS
ncbi:MAG TPA: hypothetical protein VN790_07275 [Steroidobacteraceae bacterium]|nr:hypothetical protein [Steroidobacteraceae bacterium]